ncbi:hypothetical protein CEXT_679581 [Caerostris extrusa]|uniref:Uncharacterized protein n=1 Tax=Caerostris extrusa TaxID=172846 RepID=A0AAV4NTW8_CAEEX|nr:hypothetical protein CEXT_679581 [Caerostris extrusa]
MPPAGFEPEAYDTKGARELTNWPSGHQGKEEVTWLDSRGSDRQAVVNFPKQPICQYPLPLINSTITHFRSLCNAKNANKKSIDEEGLKGRGNFSDLKEFFQWNGDPEESKNGSLSSLVAHYGA